MPPSLLDHTLDASWRYWRRSHRADKSALPLADRHYNRQKVGSPQFVPPGKCFVLLAQDERALWVSSWPIAAYVKHAWAGAWVCTMFRNEGTVLSSRLIVDAVLHTRAVWGPPPPQGFVSFVNTEKVRHKRDPGRCYLKAGWSVVGETKGGLVALGLTASEIDVHLLP